MTICKPTQIGLVLSLAMAGGVHAQTLVAAAPALSLSTATSSPLNNDIFAGRQGGLFRGASGSGYSFGDRAVSVSSLSLNHALRRSDVEGVGGVRLEAVEGTPYGEGAARWSNGGYSRVETDEREPSRLKLAADWSGALGLDTQSSNLKLGAAVGYSGHQDDVGGGYNIDARGWSGSLNALYKAPGGLYMQGAVGYAPKIKLNRAKRPGSHGQTSFGVSRARVEGASLQTGFNTPLVAGWEGGPFASVDYMNVDMAARVSRGGMPVGPRSFSRTLYSYGAEAFGHWGRLTPSLQLAYVDIDTGGLSGPSALAAARHPLAAWRRSIDSRWRDHLLAGAALDGRLRGFTWRTQLEGRFAGGAPADIRTGLVLSKGF